MNHAILGVKHIALFVAALCAALFILGGPMRAADSGFPIYFEDSKLVVKPETVNQITYLPLVSILQYLGLPYTDALALETLTIRGSKGRIVATRNSGLISIDDQIVLLRNPVLRENGHWLIPIDFLTQGLARATGTSFNYRPGARRVFAGNVDAPELVMNAQVFGSVTRLTVRSGSSLYVTVTHDEVNKRAIVSLGDKPLDPLRERLDHKDRVVESIGFDDSDGTPKILVGLMGERPEVTVTAADNNRIVFIDLAKSTLTTDQPASAPVPVEAPAPKPDATPAQRMMRVIVIDPGHGGMDSGTSGEGASEKDLTLALARRLRATLQSRLGATVLLTRDGDVQIDNETRSAVANNNQADLFISLHIGHSSSKDAAGSSLFIMKEGFAGNLSPTSGSRDTLFLPWYLGYRVNRQSSGRFAQILQEELTKALPGSRFPVRSAPLAILSSATMPSLVLEIGNINNSINVQSIQDGAFQNKLIAAIADAVSRFSAVQPRSGR